MATDLMTSRLIVRSAAEAIDNKDLNCATLAAMAKLHATDKCFDVKLFLFLSYQPLILK